MRGRVSRSTKIFVAGFALCAALAVAYGFKLVSRYPWVAVTSNFDEGKSSLFFENWPLSLLEDERSARKNLRRFPRSEQQRRLEIQLRRMKVVNSALSDIFLDSNSQFLTSGDSVFDVVSGVPWPQIITGRILSADLATPNVLGRNVSYAVLPSANGARLTEAIVLNAGDELRLNFPITKSRRTIDFKIFPLTPTSVRAFVGQHSSWGKSFSDESVNSPSDVQIPVADATASNLRLQCVQGRFLLISAKVAQHENSARMPIQVYRGSSLWAPNPKLFDSGSDSNRTAPEEPEMDAAANEESDVASSSEEVQPESELQPPVVATPAPTKELVDPLDEIANPQVPSSVKRTTALGYNIAFYQLEALPWDIVSDDELFGRLAPNLSKFFADSFQVRGKLELPSNNIELFRRTVIGTAPSPHQVEQSVILKQYLERKESLNLYAQLRTFGYHVASFATPKALGLPEQISWGSEFPLSLRGRWLAENDWKLFESRRSIDAVHEPVTGLDAVFPTKSEEVAAPLKDSDFDAIGSYLRHSTKAQEVFPDWRANEVILTDGRSQFHARMVAAYQKWQRENPNDRTFMHVYLDGKDENSRPSLKDFWKVVQIRRIRAFTDSKRSMQYAKIVHLDRAFGQMLDALTATKLQHRTVVAVLLPHVTELSAEKSGGSFFLKVPGLLPKRDKAIESISLEDVMATVFTTVGIPLGADVEDSVVAYSGHVLESTSSKTVPVETVRSGSSKVRRYYMYILPGKTGCQSIEWRSSHGVFGVEASLPVVERSQDGNALEVFPCSISQSHVELSWYQEINEQFSPEPNEELKSEELITLNAQELLGGFFYTGKKQPDFERLPNFVFGKRFLRFSDLGLSTKDFTGERVERILDAGDLRFPHNRDEVLKKLEYLAKHSKDERTVIFFGRSVE